MIIAAEGRERGFALQTVLITSVIMIMLLLSGLTATSSISTALRSQYQNAALAMAMDSGVAMAEACLRNNNFIPQWSETAPLRPNTDCSGTPITSCPEPLTAASPDSCFVMVSPGIRTTFSVGLPISDGLTQRVSSSGKLLMTRSRDNSVYRTKSESTSAVLTAQLSFQSVAFGYTTSENINAFYATIGADGIPRVTGGNAWGQAGNGTTTNSLTPVPFQLPADERAVAAYTNFLSQGRTLFILTESGNLYGAGQNSWGALGAGFFSNPQTNPVRYQLPAGVKARHVTPHNYATFVIGDDNNVYASGWCGNGHLGTNYTISGCSSVATPQRVALPTPNPADPNTIPTKNLVTDYQGAYILMEGGAVYGWGVNNRGQLANGNKTDSSVPIRMGTLGNSGQPKATSVAYDGESVWIIDDAGDVWAAGNNYYGALGGANASLIAGSDVCMNVEGGVASAGTAVERIACSMTSASQRFEWRADGTLRYTPNSSTSLCVENQGNSNVVGNLIRLWTCNGGVAQQWEYYHSYSQIRNPATGKCINNPSNGTSNGVNLQLSTCEYTWNNYWTLGEAYQLAKVQVPASAGKVISLAFDQSWITLITESGEVWSAGINNHGQQGNGTTHQRRPTFVRYQLPAGVKGVSAYVASASYSEDFSKYNTTLVIGNDGKVYGAGGNVTGQLGDGTTIDRHTPVAMQEINGTTVVAKEVKTGLGTSIILTTSGRIYTVGNNEFGQLGDGTTTNRYVPSANKYVNERRTLRY